MRNHFGTRGRWRRTGRKVRHADQEHAWAPQRTAPVTWRARLRRGISLLEVLFAVFILSMGMLGLGALIPVGNFQVSQGLRADHAAACARAAFRQIEARGMLNPKLWRNKPGNPPSFIASNSAQWPTFMLDPLFLVRGGEDIYPRSGGQAPTMGRLTLVDMQHSPDNILRLQAIARAESVFRWRDDLRGGVNGERPVFMVDNGDLSISAHEGNYSWMAMISPSLQESTVAAKLGNPAQAKRLMYNVAVIVFYKREVEPDGNDREFPRNVRQIVPEEGGFNPTTLTLTLDTKLLEDVKIVPGQWIMLSHRLNNDPSVGGTIPYHRWYRVAAAGNRFRSASDAYNIPIHVQLEGPPWPVGAIDESLRSITRPAVTIHQGVVGVYERTMEFDPNRH